MNDLLEVSGVELRHLLTTYLFDHGPATVEELLDALTYQGFKVSGRSSKVVSDALRWEIAHGRVIRPTRGRYRPARMRATEYRIDQRVKALRAQVAQLSLRGGHNGPAPLPPAA
jgi:hypothetical protein